MTLQLAFKNEESLIVVSHPRIFQNLYFLNFRHFQDRANQRFQDDLIYIERFDKTTKIHNFESTSQK